MMWCNDFETDLDFWRWTDDPAAYYCLSTAPVCVRLVHPYGKDKDELINEQLTIGVRFRGI